MTFAVRSRGSYLLAVLLIAVGAIAAWWALSRPWVSATESLLGVAPDADSVAGAAVTVVSSSGAGLFPLAAAMPVLLIAGIAAVVGSRGWGRRAVGVAIAAAASIIVVVTVRAVFVEGLASFAGPQAREVATSSLAPLVALLAGLIAVIGAALVIVGGPSWPGLGRSYERASRQPRDPWEALDAGVDPTLDDTDEPPADSK